MHEPSKHTIKLLTERGLQEDEWTLSQLEGLELAFRHIPSTFMSSHMDITKAQMGYLCGLMDLEKPDRLTVLEVITGHQAHWDTAPSTKDFRLTRWQASVLIEYYIHGDGHELNARLGFTAKSLICQEKRTARRAAKQADAHEHAAAQPNYHSA